MKKALILLVSALATGAHAQVPYTLLKDAVPNVAMVNPYQASYAGAGDGVVFFSAETPLYGNELYMTDGTEAGTVFVKDILPGPESAYPQEFQLINGRVYFKTIISSDIWVTDGTSRGTFRLAEWGSIIASTADVVFFSQNDALWRTDGTLEGTYELIDSNFTYLGTANNTAFFYRVANGSYEVWSSDGTAEETKLVTTFNQPWLTGTGLGIGNRLYFIGNAFDTGSELWYLEVNSTTPVLVKDIVPGTGSSVSSLIGEFNNKLLFTASADNDRHLYITDGTENGTFQLGDAVLWESLFHPMVVLNNEYYFIGTTDGEGEEIWKTDGTVNGTKLIKDIVPGPDPSSPLSLTAHKGKVYFCAMSPTKRKLWSTDGTTAGTVLLDAGSQPGVDGTAFVSTGGKLFFTRDGRLWATDSGVNASVDIAADNYPYNILPINDGAFFSLLGNAYFANGNQSGNTKIYALRQDVTVSGESGNLWNQGMMFATLNDKLYLTEGMGITSLLLQTDGTPEGTSVQGQLDVRIRSKFVELNGKLMFQTDLGEIWSGDGTIAGMTLVKDLDAAGTSDITFIKKFNGRIYYTARHTSGAPYETKLWSTDGTTAGTETLDLPATAELQPPLYFIIGEAGTDLLLAVRDQMLGIQIWKTNGTAAGTSLVKTLGTSITDPINVYATDGTITYFAVSDNYQFELWRSDGTDAGTYMVKNMRTGTASTTSQTITMKLIDDILCFSANDGTSGVELWKSDGTEAGTTMVVDLLPGPGDGYASLSPGPTLNGYFFFNSSNEDNDRILYKSDGTAANTTLLKNFGKPTELGWPLLEANGSLFFIGWDSDHGNELWKTDGTPEGTVIVKDIFPGKTSSFITSLTKIGSSVYFVADDGDHGYEIWMSDGSTCGTAMLTDDPNAGVYDSFIQFGQRLVFPAYDRKIGSEYSSYDLTLPPPSGCKTEQTITFPVVADKKYGDASFALEATSTSGLPITYRSSNNAKIQVVNGDAIVNGIGTVILTAMQEGNATIAEATPVSITVKIGKANLTAQADDKSKTYGDPNPQFTITYTGFVLGEDKTVIDKEPTIATDASNGGFYPLVASGGSDDHYEFEYVDGIFEIQKAPLVITAENKSTRYSDLIPGLTFTTSGLLGDDQLDDLDSPLAIYTTATIGSNAGQYPIEFDPITDNNYFVTFENGVLSIEKADQSIDFPPVDALLVGETATLTATASSGLPVTIVPASTNVLNQDNTLITLNAGLATLIAVQDGDNNYNAAVQVVRDFCVNPTKPLLSYDDGDQVITSSFQGSNMWYEDDVEIEGETLSTLEVSASGTFKAVADAGDGCVSEPSESLPVVILGLENEEDVVDVIYPSPAKDFVYVKMRSASVTPIFTWLDTNGKSMSINSKVESDVVKFDLSGLSAGMYMLKVNSSVKKIMKIN